MRELTTSDIWQELEKFSEPILGITINGVVNNNAAVMGRGIALEAAQRDKTLPFVLGLLLKRNKLQVFFLQKRGILFFPVKYKWWEKADLKLIEISTRQLDSLARKHPECTFLLPRPGCGNGRLTWQEVKPIVKNLPDNVIVFSRS